MRLRRPETAGLLFGLLLTVLSVAPSSAAEAEAEILVPLDAKVDGERVQGHEAEISAVRRGKAWALTVATRPTAGWSGVALRPDGKTWNLADRAGVAADVRNTGPRTVTVYVRVAGVKARDRYNSTVGLARLAPGASATVRVPFAPYAPTVEGVDLFGMRGYPVGGKGDVRGRMDPSGVTAVRVYTHGP
jgi:hypothetical protein